LRPQRGPRGPRSRHFAGGRWRIHARVERFVEPAVLLLLEEHPAHGYELLDRLPEILEGERVDLGNLYRILRSLEEEGFVSSSWDASTPGPAKRRYELTSEGRRVLMQWVDALQIARDRLDRFVDRFAEAREGGEHAPPS
jgi:poly-beta-hydroxybutyrate-responsive repressor